MKSNNFFRIALSVFVSFVFVFAVTYAATTISTNISTGGTLSVTDTSTLTGAVTLGTDLTVTSGTRVGADASGGHITALANDSLFVEGESEFDGISWFDGSLRASTTLMATGAATLYSTLDVSGKTTLANASSTMLTVSGNVYLATTTLTGGSSLTLGTLAADPSGTNGQMYYSTGSGAIRVYQGGSWTTLGAANGWTDGGATVYPTAMADQFLIGTTSVSGLSQLTVEATSTVGIPLTLRGYKAQTADLFRIHSVDGTELFAIDTLGNASTTQLTTSGNLWVNGFATTTASNGNFATLGTLTAVGLSTLGNASTSQITTTGNLWVNGYATTTATNGNFATLGTLTAVGLTTLGNASTSQITTTGNLWVNGYATTTATNGNFATLGTLTAVGLTTLGNASTTNTSVGAGATGELWVGGNATTTAAGNISTKGSLTLANSSTAINGIVFGFCNIANSGAVTASTTAYFNCTGATGVTTNHRVFVQATSSLHADLFVQAASSTAAGTINIQVANLGYLGASATIGDISLNFFGIR